MQLRLPKLARLLPLLTAAAVLMLFTLGSSECNATDQKQHDQQNYSYETRINAFQKAEDLYKLPVNENFPLRRNLVRFTQDQDKLGPVYVYVTSDVGTIIHYYMADAYPVNICAFLSRTDDKTGVLPSLDGIFYGGSGSSSPCNGWFIYEQASGALVEIIGNNIIVANQPLKVDAPRIEVGPKVKS